MRRLSAPVHLFMVAVLAAVLGSPGTAGAALFDESALSQGGYTRQYAGMNLQDVPETLDDDRYSLTMVRTQAMLRSDLEVAGWARFHSRLRLAREYETNYLANLQDPDELTPVSDDTGAAAGVIPRNGARSPEFYETFVGRNDLEVRELYLDLDVTPSLQLRAGKQLVAWGKGSLERALDLVQGFDGSWLPFASDEEERRKSTIMARMFYRFPARSATLEAFYQPGYDDLHDLDSSSDRGGGRNTANGIRGLDTTKPLFLPDLGSDVFIRITRPTNPHNDGADVNDEKFGLRWQGLAFGNVIEYSLAYLHTHQKSKASHHVLDPYRSDVIDTGDPRCEPNVAGGDLLEDGFDLVDDGSINGSVGCLESGERYENVLPIIDVFGGSFNYYSPTLNSVVRGEVAYLKDQLFNRKPENPALKSLNAISDQTTLFTDQISKDEYRLMLGFDRTAYFPEWLLGADRPGLLVVEFFDFFIDDYESEEEITSTLQGEVKEHTLEMVGSLGWSYWNGWLAPQVRAAADLSYGGNAILLPGFTINPSTAWKMKVTGVFVLEDTDQGTRATKFGATGDADRLITQVTYQF